MEQKPLFVFPRWSNTATLVVLLILAVLPLYAAVLIGYGLDPVTLDDNYQPVQPVAYSHALHVGGRPGEKEPLGLDCRYCHNTVEQADFAALPPTETCMNCHRAIWPKSEKLTMVRDSFGSGTGTSGVKAGDPIRWRMVTTVPDYVYFNHAAHVNSGVSCVECHGNVNHMDVVYQAKPMNMAWCVQCHRDPTDRIRPRDMVTKLDWQPGVGDGATEEVFASLSDEKLHEKAAQLGVKLEQNGSNLAASESKKVVVDEVVAQIVNSGGISQLKREMGEILKKEYHINPSTDCITCHR
jgi:menaquinone reductase, multiheme cytochrome c subunit